MKKRVKKLQKDLCRVVGHEFPNECSTCTRCGHKRLSYKFPRVNVPTSPISTNPKIKWTELNIRRYDILDRAKGRIKEDIQKDLDKRLFDEMQGE